MVVFQINVDGITFDPTKCNAPVSVGTDRIAERTDHIQNVRQQLTGVDRSPTELREARRDDNLRRNSPKNNKIKLHRR